MAPKGIAVVKSQQSKNRKSRSVRYMKPLVPQKPVVAEDEVAVYEEWNNTWCIRKKPTAKKLAIRALPASHYEDRIERQNQIKAATIRRQKAIDAGLVPEEHLPVTEEEIEEVKRAPNFIVRNDKVQRQFVHMEYDEAVKKAKDKENPKSDPTVQEKLKAIEVWEKAQAEERHRLVTSTSGPLKPVQTRHTQPYDLYISKSAPKTSFSSTKPTKVDMAPLKTVSLSRINKIKPVIVKTKNHGRWEKEIIGKPKMLWEIKDLKGPTDNGELKF